MNNLKVYFVSADYVKQNSPIIDDVENTLISSHILEAQNIDLQDCIGEDLYEYYVNHLSGYTSGDDIETLLGSDYYKLFTDYFKPFILYKSIYYSMYDLYAKITAKGITNQKSDYSNTADIKILENQRKQYNNMANSYLDRLKEYLKDNSDKYPEYENKCTNCDDDSISGLYLGDYI